MASVDYQIETPGGMVIGRNFTPSLEFVEGAAEDAVKAQCAGDVKGAAKMAALLLGIMDEIESHGEEDHYWRLATRLQAMIDYAGKRPELQESMLPAMDGQLSLF
jgi:hypothetical protein